MARRWPESRSEPTGSFLSLSGFRVDVTAPGQYWRVCKGDVLREIRLDADGRAITEPYGKRISEYRNLINGWHFARDSLTEEEWKMSSVAEELLHTIDYLCERFVH
jgi:hypothetical protein